MAQRSSATLVRDGSRHYWRGAIRTGRDTVIWECDHEHKERGADRLDYYGRSFGAMLCAAQELRGRPISERQA
jgi:hypothetical protein